jgi:signal peptidase II
MKQHALKFLILLSAMVSGCSVDLKTKSLIKAEVSEYSVSVIDNFMNITYVENHAIAFGFLNNLERHIRMPIIFALPIAITIIVFFLIYKMRNSKFRILLPLFIILGGAYGNILDRAMNGYVTDFLHFHYFLEYNFYVFNVADILINLGIILIVLQYREFNRSVNAAFNKVAINKEELNS